MSIEQGEERAAQGKIAEIRQRIDELNAKAWQLADVDTAEATRLAELAGQLSESGDYYARGLGWSLLTLGACAMERDDPAAAQQYLSKALELLAACGDRRAEAAALNLLGSMYRATGDHHRAMEHHQAALGVCREAGNISGEASALNNIGTIHQVAGRPAEAVKHHQASLEIHRQSGNRRGESIALALIANCHFAQGDYPRSLEYNQASLMIRQEMGDRIGEAIQLGNIGLVYDALGEISKSLEYYHASRTIYLEKGSRSGEAASLIRIGNMHGALGEYAVAMEHLQGSLEIRREIGDRLGEADALSDIGNIHDALGEYSQAMEHYQAGLRLYREIGYPMGEAQTLANLGGIHMTFKEYPEALEHYTASLVITREIADRKGEAAALGSIGAIHYELGRYREALDHYLEALEISRQIGDRMGEAYAVIAVARASGALGDFPTALARHESALELAHSVGTRVILEKALFAQGETFVAMQRPEDAIRVLTESLALADELGERTHMLETCELLAGQFEQLGDAPRALAYLRRHLTLQKEIFSEETRQTVTRLQTGWHIEVARKEAEIERLRNVELKQALDDLKAAQSQLVQSEKMASLGQLTAGIAHEINNPINFVSASIKPVARNHSTLRSVIDELALHVSEQHRQRIFEDFEVDETFEELDQLVSSIGNGAARTTEIVSGLRSFSRLDEGGLKSVDLHEGLDATLALLSGTIGGRIAIEREYDELPEVECYPGEINQVFLNILTNAIKAIDREGTVRIRTEAVDDIVRIAITDSGTGMTPDVQQRIFEPFFTTRDVGQGRGLGLSIAWGIIQKHGGSIEVGSTPGNGSSFAIVLPVRFAGD